MLCLRSMLTITLVSLSTAACGLSPLELRANVDLHAASFHDKLKADRARTEAFMACTQQAYDERMAAPDPTVPIATPSLTPTPGIGDRLAGHLKPIHDVIERVKERGRGQADSLRTLEDLVQDWKTDARGLIDLDRLHNLIALVKQWHAHLDFDEDALAKDGSRFARLLLAYNKAYFGDVRYVAGDPIPGSGIRPATKISSDGFTDRNGNVWRFPGLSADTAKDSDHASSQVGSQRLSADLVRIFLEAFFDAAFREPAVQGATALQVEWKDGTRSYPVLDAEHPAIPLDAFARITRDALRAEAATTSLVGKAVRGGSVFSIQNETIAATLETAAGVIAKKLVEHEGFCYYQTLQANHPAGH